MEKRVFGRSGEKLSVLGVGGFHLLEVSDSDAVRIMNEYLDEGGNYIETAPQYGNGESERKVGLVMRERRSECFLTTKNHIRDREGAAEIIEESLKRLHTDHVDLLIFHHVQSDDEVDQIQKEAYDRIKSAMVKHPTRLSYLINLLLISRHLERLADHATNIAEEVIYLIEGEIVRHAQHERG